MPGKIWGVLNSVLMVGLYGWLTIQALVIAPDVKRRDDA